MIAVLTADFVGSTALTSTEHQQITSSLTNTLLDYQRRNDIMFELHRGDSFQIVYQNPSDAVRHSIVLKLYFLLGLASLPIDMTQSLAIGDFDSLSDSAGTSIGPVFTASGRSLSATRKTYLSVKALPYPQAQASIDVATAFLNRQLSTLSSKQLEVLYHYLNEQFPEQQIIADNLSVTRQNVAMHLKRANADLIRAYIEHFSTLLEGNS